MQRTDSVKTYPLEHHRHSSNASEAPNTPVSPVAQLLPRLSAYGPPACYVAASAAASHVLSDQKARAAERLGAQSPATTTVSNPTFTEGSLLLLNAFLDHLLYHFLETAKSTALVSLRPAVEQVLKGKLARQAVASAEEELEDLLGADNEDQELELLRTAPEKQSKWDTDAVFRRVRAKVMVYMSLADMDDEEELDADDDDDPGLVSWAASIFLTSVMEHVAEQCLSIAGQAAYERASSKTATSDHPSESTSFNDASILIAEQDVERISLATSLGRLWRAWRKALRSAKNRTSNSSSSQQSESTRDSSQIVRASISSIAGNSETGKIDPENVAITVIPEHDTVLNSASTTAAATTATTTTTSKPTKLQFGDDGPPQLASITEIESPGEVHATQRVSDEYREITTSTSSSSRPQNRRPQSLLLHYSPIHSYPTPEASPNQPPDLEELRRNAKRRKYLSLPDPYRPQFSTAELDALRNAGEAEAEILVKESRRKSKRLSRAIQAVKDSQNSTKRSSTALEDISDSSPPVTPIEDDGEEDLQPKLDPLGSPSPLDEQPGKRDYLDSAQDAQPEKVHGSVAEEVAHVDEHREMTQTREDTDGRKAMVVSDVPADPPVVAMAIRPQHVEENDISNHHETTLEEHSSLEMNHGAANHTIAKVSDTPDSERSDSAASGIDSISDMSEPERRDDLASADHVSDSGSRSSDEKYHDFDDADLTRGVEASQSRTSQPQTVGAAIPPTVHSFIRPNDKTTGVEFNTMKNRLDDRHVPSLDAVPENSIHQSRMNKPTEPSARTSTDEPIGHANQYTIGQMVDMLSEPEHGIAVPAPASSRMPTHRGHGQQQIGSISATRVPKEPSPKPSIETTSVSVKPKSKRPQGSQGSSISELSSSKKAVREFKSGTVSPIIDDRASVKRVSGESPRMSSSRLRNGANNNNNNNNNNSNNNNNNNADGPFITRKVSRQSSDTLESGNNARRSEVLEKEFAELLAGEETVKYTLTPRSLTEIEQPDSPRYRAGSGVNGRGVEEEDDDEDDEEEDVGDHADPVSVPGALGIASATATWNSKSSDRHIPAVPEEPKAYVPVSRPPALRSGSFKSGLVARDARPQNESIRDFADFIRSTAPDRQPPQADQAQPVAGKVSQSQPMKNSKLELQSSQSGLNNTFDGPIPSASPAVRPASSKSKASLQPREATARGRGYNAEMLEFLRQGPADGPARNGRINDFSADSATLSSNRNASSVYSGSAQDSLRSSTALLPKSNANPGLHAQGSSSSGIARTQRRVKDPYQIDFSDDEDEEFYATRTRKPEQESMLDFLRNVAPPSAAASSSASAGMGTVVSDFRTKRPATSGQPAPAPAASASSNATSRPTSQRLSSPKSMFGSYLEDSKPLDLALGPRSSSGAAAPSPEATRNGKKPTAKRSFWRKITS